MTEENMYDKVMDRLLQRSNAVKDRLSLKFRKTNPFRQELMSSEMNDYIYDNMTPEDVSYAVNTYGRETVNQWMFKTEQRRNK